MGRALARTHALKAASFGFHTHNSWGDFRQAIYFGHPEADLAYVDFFAPVSGQLFDGYQELASIEHGFSERRELWRIPARLAMIEVLGPRQVPKLVTALRSLV